MGKKGGTSKAQSTNPQWLDNAGSELWNFAKNVMFKPAASSGQTAPTQTIAPSSTVPSMQNPNQVIQPGSWMMNQRAAAQAAGGNSRQSASSAAPPAMSLDNLRTDIVAPLDPNIDHAAMRARTSSGTAGPSYFQPAIGYVEQSTQGFGKEFNPNSVAFSGWGQEAADKYMNPFVKAVLEQSSNELMRAGDIEKLKKNDAMLNAGAFGGSRHGIEGAEMHRNLLDTLGRQYQSGLADAYSNAQQMFTSDEGRRLQTDTYNEDNRFRAHESGRDQFNQEKNRLLQAASTMGNLATQHSNIQTQDVERLLKTGAVKTDQRQKQMDAPYTQLDRLSAILSGSPSRNSISYQQQPNSFAQTLGGLGSLAGGIGMMGGFGGGSAGVSAAATALPYAGFMGLSDESVKENVTKVGEFDGIEIVEFNYMGSDTRYRGVIAQQVEEVRPDAVIRREDGFLTVDYAAIGIPFERLENGYGV